MQYSITPAAMERYSRHTMLSQIGYDGQQRLFQSSVLIVGVGGLGSPIALYLAAAGVGRIGLIDDDIVSISNLQRQVLYREDEVGRSKVTCAKQRLLQLNSNLTVDSYNERLTTLNASQIISKYDVIVDGCDNISTRYIIDEACANLNRPYVYGSIGEFTGQVSVFNCNGARKYRDLFPPEYAIKTPQPPIGVMGVTPGVIGSIQATEVIKIITHCGDILTNRLLSLNLLTMECNIISL